MTVAQAFRLLEHLHAQADQGWPKGFHAPTVLRQARSALDALSRAVERVPTSSREHTRADIARRLVALCQSQKEAGR